MKSMHVLLRNAIDYAGLFPPAGLDMRSAVRNFAGYLAGEASWALGRFVVPVARLDEFTVAAEPLLPTGSAAQVWHLAGLSGSNLDDDLRTIADFNRRYAVEAVHPRIVLDSLELKASSVDEVRDTMHRIPGHLQAYVEIPIDREPAPLLDCISGSSLRAKVRTGGITSDAFPRASDLLGFIDAAVRARVPFKATAGLHHPFRAEYRLTYAPDSGRGRMFGFMNVFLTAALLHAGMDGQDALDLLEEGSHSALQVDDEGIRWRNYRLGLSELRSARRAAIIAFGSCSFTEPVEELEALHLLEPRVPQA